MRLPHGLRNCLRVDVHGCPNVGVSQQFLLHFHVNTERPKKSALVTFGGKYGSADGELPAEIIDLLGFGFEIAVIEMRQDEIQKRQLRADVFDGMLATIAEIFPTDGAIEQAGDAYSAICRLKAMRTPFTNTCPLSRSS
jgi:hypothetical protein